MCDIYLLAMLSYAFHQIVLLQAKLSDFHGFHVVHTGFDPSRGTELALGQTTENDSGQQ